MASSVSHSTFGPLSFGPRPAAIPVTRTRHRVALLISPDTSLRERLSETLSGLRWQVREAASGAQAWAAAEGVNIEAAIVDSWLPDLDLSEFLKEFRGSFPGVDVLTVEGAVDTEAPRSPYRQELLFALRASQDATSGGEWRVDTRTDTAAWNTAPEIENVPMGKTETEAVWPGGAPLAAAKIETVSSDQRLPELIGHAPAMLEIGRRVRLVAPRSTPVLIEGPTGSGKELVARALHRLSSRAGKPFAVINCAAIPEALLEAELFGHTRGAFTGAVHGRTGRIEAADGGTLFLDEIGEMPLALQSKLLRFVECGELQRVGDNETVKVDVRILAATHQPLARNASEGNFRSDLYYRLAVFLIRTPPLSERSEDLPVLVQHFLDKMGRVEPVKRIDSEAVARLTAHSWPGNVRELQHVLERAAILAGNAPVIRATEIEFGVPVQG